MNQDYFFFILLVKQSPGALKVELVCALLGDVKKSSYSNLTDATGIANQDAGLGDAETALCLVNLSHL